ncbi:hypothetical protein AADG42_03910 [Ammonicoccus fulvus]|uniref:Uncharacterized protein n=1 Tax=Ammonicoccus fulvus TaxID=3138240 RepID=A0ABZ3FKD1_9ACTN
MLLDEIRRDNVIAIDKRNPLTFTSFDAHVAGSREPLILLRNQVNTGIALTPCMTDGRTSIGGSVIDDDNIQPLMRLRRD